MLSFAPEPPVPTNTPISSTTIIFLLWLLGGSLTTAHLAYYLAQNPHFPPPPLLHPRKTPALSTVIQNLACSLQLRAIPQILLSSEATAPFLTGLLRPAIILPTNLATASPQTLEHILTHELAHLARRDLWWNLLPALLSIPFFFHPLLWLARREWLAAQEIACDQLTLAATNAPPADYARTLLDIVTRKSRPGLFAAGMGTFATTKRRMKAMTHPPSKSVRVAAIALAAAFGVLPWRLVAQATPDNSPPAAPAPETGIPPPATIRDGARHRPLRFLSLRPKRLLRSPSAKNMSMNSRPSPPGSPRSPIMLHQHRTASRLKMFCRMLSLHFEKHRPISKSHQCLPPPSEDADRFAADNAAKLQAYQQLLARREAEMANSATAIYHAVISSRSVTLGAAVDGAIREIPVVDGQRVKAGELLVALDSRDQAIALKLAEIDLKSAKKTLDRFGDNTALSSYERDQAEVAEQRAEIAVEKAKSDLDKTFIRAPIDGLVRLSDIAPGAFVAKGSPVLTVLDANKSVSVHVTADDARLLHIGQSISLQRQKDLKAEITYISPEVDSATGTCLVKAVLKSGADEFRSGQFTNISFPRN